MDEWVRQRIIRFYDEMKAALAASAPEPITLRLWLPHYENRRLPMPLKYAP